MLWIFVRVASGGNSNKNPQHVFLRVKRKKKALIIYHTGT